MANISKTLEEAMKIDGAIAAALADWESGLCLGTAGGGARLNVEVAAAGNCQVVKAKMATMRSRGISGAIQDILITLDTQYHLIIPLRQGNLFLYMAIDRNTGNLALARRLFAGESLGRSDRAFALSAARSTIFNAVLDRRVREVLDHVGAKPLLRQPPERRDRGGVRLGEGEGVHAPQDLERVGGQGSGESLGSLRFDAVRLLQDPGESCDPGFNLTGIGRRSVAR